MTVATVRVHWFHRILIDSSAMRYGINESAQHIEPGRKFLCNKNVPFSSRQHYWFIGLWVLIVHQYEENPVAVFEAVG